MVGVGRYRTTPSGGIDCPFADCTRSFRAPDLAIRSNSDCGVRWSSGSALYLFIGLPIVRLGRSRKRHFDGNVRQLLQSQGQHDSLRRSGRPGSSIRSSLTESLLTPRDWRPASPSHLLPVLLIWGEAFGLAADWDLRALDRLSMKLFYTARSKRFLKDGN